MASRYRDWCFTLHADYAGPGGVSLGQADAWALADDNHLPIAWPRAAFTMYQVEVAPETNAVHLQGFMHFGEKVTFDRAAMAFYEDWAVRRVHLERMCGTVGQNIEYCSKSDSAVAGPFEHGVRPVQGRRTDWHDAREIVLRHGTDREILDAHPNLAPNIRGVQALRDVYDVRAVRRDVHVFVLWGSAGVGKSYMARMQCPDAFVVHGRYMERLSFDGYVGQSTVIFDEWLCEEWPMTILNTCLDCWGAWLPSRYHNVWTSWTTVVICSNQDPVEWYYGNALRATVLRRIGQVYQVTLYNGEYTPKGDWPVLRPS